MFSISTLTDLVEGRWTGPTPGRGPEVVAHDTRHPLREGLFVAIAGAHQDGHDLLEQAQAAGATMAMVTRPMDHPLPQLVVEDALVAIARLAAAWRHRLTSTRVIAITGTAGKTSTKDLLHHVLGSRLRGSASPASWNNAVGGPMSLLRSRLDDAYVILEAGTSSPGEIAALGHIMQPDIAVITLIGHGHLEGLGSREGVRREKYALLEHVRSDGLALVHRDEGEPDCTVRCLRYGDRPDADPRLVSFKDGVLELADGGRFRLPWTGRHHAINALAVVTIARELGLSDDLIDGALSTARPSDSRGTSRILAGIRITDDSYNANPDSMRAALEAFSSTPTSGRRVVILGDMLELGASSPSFHAALASEVTQAELILLVGPRMQALARALGDDSRVRSWPEADDSAMRSIAGLLRRDDEVLLKGSRGIGLERILAHLRDGESEGAAT